MKPVLTLNRITLRQSLALILFVLGVLFGVGALWMQLTGIYARPKPLPVSPTRLPAGLPDAAMHIPDGKGFQPIIPQQGLLLIYGPEQLIGQQDLSLCEQSTDSTNGPIMAPLYVGWDGLQLQQAIAHSTIFSQPLQNLKNPLLDDGPDGVDIPAFSVVSEPADAPLPLYANAGSFRLTLHDARPILLLADTAESSQGPTLSFRRDLWLLWNEGPAATGQWNHGLRLRLLADDTCRFGLLRVSVYGLRAADTAGLADTESRTVLWYKGDGSIQEFHLAPGYYAPAAPSPPREDAELFERALAAGLLRSSQDGRIAIAPADLPLRRVFAQNHPDLLVPRDGEHDWLQGPWNGAARQAHQALHFSGTGRYVRRQVAIFNARQLLAAIRWRPDFETCTDWQADWGEVPLTLVGSMPLLAERLFAEAPQGWRAWRRVAHWPDLEQRPPVRFRCALPKAAQSGDRLELLVAGKDLKVTGATVLASAPRCLSAQPCTDRDALAHWLRLEMQAGATQLELAFQPLPAAVFPDLYRYDFAHIQRIDGNLYWRDLPVATDGGRVVRATPAEVTLRDQQGTLLWASGQPTQQAWDLGLAALVGLDPAQRGSVQEVLARLGERGVATVEARLSVDPRLQRAARQALQAQLSLGDSVADGHAIRQEEPMVSFVVLDADRGDILAVIANPEPPADIVWSDLSTFVAAVPPRRNPLWIRAWQRDGDAPGSVGSIFELIDALLLEREALHRPRLAAALAGATIGGSARLALKRREERVAGTACYLPHAKLPKSRMEGRLRFRNGDTERSLRERMWCRDEQRHEGLAQALRDSARAWFARWVVTTDTTLSSQGESSPLASARALTPAALRKLRPLLGIIAELGFDVPQNLDGSLLPSGLIVENDVLQASTAVLEPMTDRKQIWRAALGQGVYLTPLQLAEAAAVIATGQRKPSRVLAELNDQPALEPVVTALNISTNRIRQGMHLSLNVEPARSLFADARFDTIRPLLYVKMGAARRDPPGKKANAWLAGWLEPGALPGENRRLAFACLISPVTSLESTNCGALTAAWLAALRAVKDHE